MARLRAGELARPHQAVALDHAPRHRQHQPESEVGGRLGGDRRHDRDRNAPRGRRGDVDVGGRDRLRRDGGAASGWRRSRRGRSGRAAGKTGYRSCLHRRDQRCLGDDAARVRIDLRRVATLRRRSIALLATGWVTKMRRSASADPPHDAGDAVDRDLRAVRDAAGGVEHAEHHRDAALARERGEMRGRAAELGDHAGDARQHVARAPGRRPASPARRRARRARARIRS